MFRFIKNHIGKCAVHQTRTGLMGLTDRQLKDAGILRHLLQKGINARPWRENNNKEVNQSPYMPDRGGALVPFVSRRLSRVGDFAILELTGVPFGIY
jgi:hypothetical protein